METYVSVVVLLEAIAVLFCVWGMLHENKLVKYEHAFAKAVIWTLWEKITHREWDMDVK